MIDRGHTDAWIASRVGTDANTISVYRKAHDGTLTTIVKPYWSRASCDRLKQQILYLLRSGMTGRETARELKCAEKTVRKYKKAARI